MQTVVDAWSLGPAAVVSVGDAPSDVTAARAVGVSAVGAAWATTTDRSLLVEKSPDAIFDRVADFGAWLRER
jgi:phosphoglycolate phosphatase/pyrophosphatase PpaX